MNTPKISQEKPLDVSLQVKYAVFGAHTIVSGTCVLVKFYVSWKYVERSQFMLSVAETIMFTVCCTT